MAPDPRISECLRALTRATMYLTSIEDANALATALSTAQCTQASIRSALNRREADVESMRIDILAKDELTKREQETTLALHEDRTDVLKQEYDSLSILFEQQKQSWDAREQELIQKAAEQFKTLTEETDGWIEKCNDLTILVASLNADVLNARKAADAAEARLDSLSVLLKN